MFQLPSGFSDLSLKNQAGWDAIKPIFPSGRTPFVLIKPKKLLAVSSRYYCSPKYDGFLVQSPISQPCKLWILGVHSLNSSLTSALMLLSFRFWNITTLNMSLGTTWFCWVSHYRCHRGESWSGLWHHWAVVFKPLSSHVTALANRSPPKLSISGLKFSLEPVTVSQ